MDSQRHLLTTLDSNGVSHVRAGLRRLRLYLKDSVARARHIDEDVACAQTIQDSGNREFLCLNDGGRMADCGGNLLPLGCLMVVTAANARQPEPLGDLFIPER